MSIISEPAISWARQDIEQMAGFRGGRFTAVNTKLAMLLGIAGFFVFYAALLPIRETAFGEMFFLRGSIPFVTVFFTSWTLAILLIKSRKLGLQRKALNYNVVPTDHSFILSAANVEQVMKNIYAAVDDPRHFVLFNRITIALANLRNLGRVTDVDDILRSQAAHDESIMDSSYSLIVGFIWAIPVLGFIGTVLGLSQAIGSFGEVLQAAGDLSQIKAELKNVTRGLATAFETTLQALVAALFIQLLQTFLRKSEEEFMDACSEYCVENVVNRLRIMPFEEEHD